MTYQMSMSREVGIVSQSVSPKKKKKTSSGGILTHPESLRKSHRPQVVEESKRDDRGVLGRVVFFGCQNGLHPCQMAWMSLGLALGGNACPLEAAKPDISARKSFCRLSKPVWRLGISQKKYNGLCVLLIA
jgi:hypothetical protein